MVRKGWDSNPRGSVNPLAVFKTAALNHSATLPYRSNQKLPVNGLRTHYEQESLSARSGESGAILEPQMARPRSLRCHVHASHGIDDAELRGSPLLVDLPKAERHSIARVIRMDDALHT